MKKTILAAAMLLIGANTAQALSFNLNAPRTEDPCVPAGYSMFPSNDCSRDITKGCVPKRYKPVPNDSPIYQEYQKCRKNRGMGPGMGLYNKSETLQGNIITLG
jgi:hypothetical protein